MARHLDEAAALAERTGARLLTPLVPVERAELARIIGDEPARQRELREAHRQCVQSGATARAARLAELIA